MEQSASLTDSPANPQVVYDPAARSPMAAAVDDIMSGVRNWYIWMTMGWLDIKLRYRGSVLGPFWITISMSVTIAAMGFLYGTLFRIELHDYLPFLTLGFLAWQLISALIIEGCTTFVSVDRFIKQVHFPYSVYVYRLVWRNLIIFLHNLVVYVGVALVFRITPTPATLLIIPGLILIALNGAWVAMLLGMICARFLDMPQVFASLVQLSFFVTPVIWKPGLLRGRAYYFVDANPFHHFVELVRSPLYGQAPSALTWAVVVGMSVGGWLMTLLIFRRYRTRIAFWV